MNLSKACHRVTDDCRRHIRSCPQAATTKVRNGCNSCVTKITQAGRGLKSLAHRIGSFAINNNFCFGTLVTSGAAVAGSAALYSPQACILVASAAAGLTAVIGRQKYRNVERQFTDVTTCGTTMFQQGVKTAAQMTRPTEDAVDEDDDAPNLNDDSSSSDSSSDSSTSSDDSPALPSSMRDHPDDFGITKTLKAAARSAHGSLSAVTNRADDERGTGEFLVEIGSNLATKATAYVTEELPGKLGEAVTAGAKAAGNLALEKAKEQFSAKGQDTVGKAITIATRVAKQYLPKSKPGYPGILESAATKVAAFVQDAAVRLDKDVPEDPNAGSTVPQSLAYDDAQASFAAAEKQPVSVEQSTNYITQAKEALKNTSMLVLFKGLFNTFVNSGVKNISFEQILKQVRDTLRQRGEENNFQLASDLFVKALKDSMRRPGNKTPWYTALYINAFVIPMIYGNAKPYISQVSNSLWDSVTASLYEHASDNDNGNNAKPINGLAKVFQEVVAAKEKAQVGTMSQVLNGGTKERVEFYKKTTIALIDEHFKPITFIDKLTKAGQALYDKTNGVEAQPFDRICLTPIYTIARGFIFLFKMLMFLPVLLLNTIIKAVAKGLIIKNKLLDDFVDSSVELLSDSTNRFGLTSELLSIVMKEANTAISQLLDEEARVINTENDPTAEEVKDAKEFIKLLLTSSSKYANSPQTLEELIIGLVPVEAGGKKLIDQGLDALTPVIVNLYKQLTKKKELDRYLSMALQSVNESLEKDIEPDPLAIDPHETAAAKRRDLDSTLAVFTHRILTLGSDVLRRQYQVPASHYNDMLMKMAEETTFRFSRGDLIATEDADIETITQNLEKINEAIANVENAVATIHKYTNESKHSKPLKAILPPAINAALEMRTLLYKKREVYEAHLYSKNHGELVDEGRVLAHLLSEDCHSPHQTILNDQIEKSIIRMATILNRNSNTLSHDKYDEMKNSVKELIEYIVKRKYYSNSKVFADKISYFIPGFSRTDTKDHIHSMFTTLRNEMGLASSREFLENPEIAALIEHEDTKLDIYKDDEDLEKVDFDGVMTESNSILTNLFRTIIHLRKEMKEDALFNEELQIEQRKYAAECTRNAHMRMEMNKDIERVGKELVAEVGGHEKGSVDEYADFIALKDVSISDEELNDFYNQIGALQMTFNTTLEKRVSDPTNPPVWQEKGFAAGIDFLKPVIADVVKHELDHIAKMVGSEPFTRRVLTGGISVAVAG